MSEQQKMDADLRQIVTEALVNMVSGVTGLVPPTGPGQIPDFIQAPIDRAVEKISASLPVGVPDGYAIVPVKPDIEMVEAGYEASLGQPDRSAHARVIEQYDAMLAAAPTVKAEQVLPGCCGTPENCPIDYSRCPHLGQPPAPSLPAAGSAVEEVEVVAWVTPEKDRAITALTEAAAREDGGAMLSSVRPYSVPCMTVAQCLRMLDQLRAALSAQKSAQPEFCCELSYKAAKQKAWNARRIDRCKCDHNEYCDHCWPADFRPGGKWHGKFVAQQSTHVSVPMELLERLEHVTRQLAPHLQCHADLIALLNGGEA